MVNSGKKSVPAKRAGGKNAASQRNGIWPSLVGKQVVIDLSSPFVFVGRLVQAEEGFVLIEDADAHDLRDTSTTRDQYVRQVRLHGININRRHAWVRLDEIVALSLLEDVVID